MKDRYGLEYEECLKYQREHLALWRTRVFPNIMDEVEAYCLRNHRQATSPEQKHQVFRGQEIIEIIRTWPNVNTAYMPPVHPPAAADLI